MAELKRAAGSNAEARVIKGDSEMSIASMNWMQVEDRVRRDDRCVLPIGSVEQHGYLSLCVDMILAERVAVEAAKPLGVPVFPAVPYGVTPSFVDFPGTVSLKLTTYVALIGDILEGLYRSGFRRIVVVNGHGGNGPIASFFAEWMGVRRDACVKFHEWWKAPRTWEKVMSIDTAASHASWMENFPWTRISGVVMPPGAKEELDRAPYSLENPAGRRRMLGDGNFHGLYQRSDAEMLAIWEVAVAETRAVIADDWRAAKA
jgi:creatinine amidohydrolase